MTLPASDHERVRSAFVRALDLPRSQRPGFVRHVLADRPDLAEHAELMLADADDPTMEPAGDGATQVWEEPLLAKDQLGDYRILGLIGRGGMAVVLHAEHASTGREVALKLLPLGTASKELRERLVRESDVLRTLRHANIARWRDGGELMTPEGPRPFMAMDYVHGRSILEWVRTQRPDTKRRLHVLEQVARAVHFAHEHDVVHRDLKPSNILVDAHDRACVLDFGVAKILGAIDTADASLTQAGQIVGTLRFMSPEQAAGQIDAIGPATDVHALGLMIHEVMTGTPPYPVPSNVAEALPAIVHAERTRPQVDDPRLGQALEKILDAALAREPSQRLQDASLLADDLAAAREGRAVPRRRGRIGRYARRARRPVQVAVFVALLLTVVGLLSRDAVMLGLDTHRGSFQDVLTTLSDTGFLLDSATQDTTAYVAALDDLVVAAATLRANETWPGVEEWRRLVAWREGEICHVLGMIASSPARIEQAQLAWESAVRIDPERTGLDTVLALDVTARDTVIVREVKNLEPSMMMRQIATVHSILARRHGDASSHGEHAREWHQRALSEIARERLGPGVDWRDLQPSHGDAEQGHLRSELAADLVHLAALQGRVDCAQEAIAHLRNIEDFAMLESDSLARAAARYLRGRARLIEAVIDTSAAPLDRAEHWFRRSLEDRPFADRPRAHVRSQIALVQVDRMRTRFSSTPDSAAIWFESVLQRAATLQDSLGATADRAVWGRLASATGGAAVEAMLAGRREAQPIARTWLDRAREALVPEQSPVEAAWLDIDEARYQRACMNFCDEPVDVHFERALLHLGAAAGSYRRAQYERLHVAIDRERHSWARAVALGARK